MKEHQWYYLKPGMLEDRIEGAIPEAEFLARVKAGYIKLDVKAMSPTRTKQKWCELKQIPGIVKIANQGVAERKATRRRQVAGKAAQKQQNGKETTRRKQEAAGLKEEQRLAARRQRQRRLELDGIAQEMEKLAVHVRRQMEFEGRSAALPHRSLNVSAAGSARQPAPVVARSGDDLVARLGQLKAVLDSNLITQEEFDKRKADILAEL